MIHPHLPEFLERYPKIDIQMLLEDRYVDLIDDGVDLALRITEQPPGTLWVENSLILITWFVLRLSIYQAWHTEPPS